MENRYRILNLLADGHFHSGEQLGETLGVSRSAVWKQLGALEALGVEVFAVRGRGYRLSAPLELLHREHILAQLGPAARRLLAALEIHHELDSTNRHLMRNAQTGLRAGHACLAERQTHGRGRRGRSWISPFGSNIYLSLFWRFPGSPAAVAGLSLASGVAAARALAEAGAEDVSLKWPNDLFWNGRKLGGVLLEMAGEASGPCHVVVGVGLNDSMPRRAGAGIDQPWTDLRSITGGTVVSRNRVAGLLLRHLLLAVHEYQVHGVAPFLGEWQNRDMVSGRAVELRLPDRTVTGTARGIDTNGALLVENATGVASFSSGEVSLRLSP